MTYEGELDALQVEVDELLARSHDVVRRNRNRDWRRRSSRRVVATGQRPDSPRTGDRWYSSGRPQSSIWHYV